MKSLWILILGTCLFAHAAGNKPAEVGVVVKIGGAKKSNCHRIPKGQKTQYRLNNDDPIYEGDTLVTEKGSFLKVLMNDDTVMSLGPNARFEMQSFKMNPKDKADRKSVYKLTKGKLRALFTVKAKNENDLKIVTPSVAMGVRGTEILSDVYKFKGQSQTDIALLSGKLNLTPTNMQESFKLDVGEAISVGSKLNPKDFQFRPVNLNKSSLTALRKNSSAFLPRLKNRSGKKVDVNKAIKQNIRPPKVDIKNQGHQKGQGLKGKQPGIKSGAAPVRSGVNDSAKQALKEHKKMVQGVGARGKQYRKRAKPKFINVQTLCQQSPSHPVCTGDPTGGGTN